MWVTSPTCSLCGFTIAWDDVSLDHIVPRSLGGAPSVRVNVQLTHTKCNNNRANDPVDYTRMRLFLQQRFEMPTKIRKWKPRNRYCLTPFCRWYEKS